ncbi:MAG TPA: hypothetical protein VGY14_05230 [Methyloceanibacter sp.]|jgi:hypothetical protein|nr:hypothetical protein [Methyloceanibacter sp.]
MTLWASFTAQSNVLGLARRAQKRGLAMTRSVMDLRGQTTKSRHIRMSDAN